jgi:hypothetical protein
MIMCAHYRRAMSYQGKVKWYVLLLSMNYLWKFLNIHLMETLAHRVCHCLQKIHIGEMQPYIPVVCASNGNKTLMMQYSWLASWVLPPWHDQGRRSVNSPRVMPHLFYFLCIFLLFFALCKLSFYYINLSKKHVGLLGPPPIQMDKGGQMNNFVPAAHPKGRVRNVFGPFEIP